MAQEDEEAKEQRARDRIRFPCMQTGTDNVVMLRSVVKAVEYVLPFLVPEVGDRRRGPQEAASPSRAGGHLASA